MKLAIIAASLILAGSAQAQSLKEKYELSERCGKQAAERFAKLLSDVYQQPSRYENHYNSRLNRCFYLETYFDHNVFGPITEVTTLIDLHENRELGKYQTPLGKDWQMRCEVQRKECKTEEEWRAL